MGLFLKVRLNDAADAQYARFFYLFFEWGKGFWEMAEYYRLSGKVNPLYVALFLFGAVLVAALSVVYAIGMYYMPSVYFCALVTIALAGASGFIAAKAAEWGKARNALVWGLALLAYFAVFTYVHLTAYAAVVFREEGQVIDLEWFWYILRTPSITYEAFSEWIIPYGVWSFTSGSEVSGGFLVAIWAVEHLAVLGVSALVFHSLTRKPFFEETGRWCEQRICLDSWERQPETEFGRIREALEGGRLDYFRALKPSGPDSSQYCRLSCYADPQNEGESVYLGLANVSVTVDKKGNGKTAENHIVRNLIFPERSYRKLEMLAKEAGEAGGSGETPPDGEKFLTDEAEAEILQNNP